MKGVILATQGGEYVYSWAHAHAEANTSTHTWTTLANGLYSFESLISL